MYDIRKLADKIAASGYYVVAPDYFRGDPLVNISDLPMWIVRHLPVRVNILLILFRFHCPSPRQL